MGRRSKYPERFRRNAAESLALDGGRAVRDVARELGVNYETLRERRERRPYAVNSSASTLNKNAVFRARRAGPRHRRWAVRTRQAVPRVVDPSPDSRARCPECRTVWVVGVDHKRRAAFCSRRRGC